MSRISDDNKRQNSLIFMCCLIYVASYVSRYSYNSNIVAIKDYYDSTNSVTGLVSTFFFFAYGVGQIINGLLCKKYNKKIFLSGALIISAVINFILFVCPPIVFYKYLWLLNGISLSVLWSLLVLTLSQNLDEKHLEKAMVVMSLPVPVGTIISYGTSSLFNLICDFRFSFLFGGLTAGAVAVLWITRCDQLLVGNVGAADGKEKKTTEKSPIGAMIVVSLVLFGFFMMIDNFVKDGINTWVPQILKDNYNLGDSMSIFLTLTLPVLGFFGALLSVWITKKTTDNVALVGLLFLASAACIFTVTLLLKGDSFLAVAVIFGILSLITHCINSILTNVLPLKLRDKLNSGVMAGVLNGCGYAGSTVSAYCLGLIADGSGWDSVMTVLVSVCLTACAASFIYFLFSKFMAVGKRSSSSILPRK